MAKELLMRQPEGDARKVDSSDTAETATGRPRRPAISEFARAARQSGWRVIWSKWLALAILVVGVLDSVSTELALASGGAREANPIVRYLLDNLGVFWLAPKMAVHGALAWMAMWYPNLLTLIALSLVSALAGLAAANNFAIYFDVIGAI